MGMGIGVAEVGAVKKLVKPHGIKILEKVVSKRIKHYNIMAAEVAAEEVHMAPILTRLRHLVVDSVVV